FDLSMVGKGFVTFARLLPFVHAVELGQKALRGEFAALLPRILHLAYSEYGIFCLFWLTNEIRGGYF
ncbi:MAG: hypothetical protein II215_02575, partial [Paludibacteraceae bacterium]|nr:hypothetical protein [Paludibacteraceae bacterium]